MTTAAGPKNWKWVRFGDVAHQVKDRVNPETADIERYVAGEHMETDEIRIRRWGVIGDDYLGPAFHMRFRPGHVLYGSRRTYLRKVVAADFEGICANTTFVVEPATDELLPRFLLHVMKTKAFHRHSIEQSKGSVNPYINFKDLNWYEFPLPDTRQQEDIVEVLSSIEECILRIQELGRALEELTESMVSEAEDRASDWTLLDRILQEPPRNGLTIRPAADETGIWSLTVASMSEHGYSPHGCRPIEAPENADRYLVHPGDLFVTRSNTLERVGLPALVPPDAPTSLYYSDLLMRLRPDESKIPSRLLEHVLRSRRARAFLRSIAAGTSASMKKINGRNLRRLPVPLLPAGLVDDTIGRLSLLDAARIHQRSHEEATQNLLNRTREALLAGGSDV